MRKYSVFAGALLLLAIFMCELTGSVRHQSLSWDEGDHIFAGYQSWKTGDFGINPEHPPFVKELATLPLLSMHLTTPAPKGLPFFKDEAYFDGRDLIFNNGGEPTADRIIFRVRMAAATLSLLLGVLVFLAGREIFGNAAALFALALVVFEPNLIAHGAYVTTDMGVSCFMFGTIYALYRYMNAPSLGRLLCLGAATGLTLASKHSGVLILPMALAIAAIEIAWPQDISRKQVASRFAAAFSGGTVIGIFILWSTYGFRFSARPDGVHMQPSLAEYAQPLPGIEPRIYLLFAKLRILPESYLFGMVDVRRLANSFPGYIFGKIHAHGVPYYFPAAFIIKSTLAFMILMLIAAFAILTRRFRARRELIFFGIPPLIYLLIATGTGLNIGARHILPMYAFLALLISGAVVALARTNRKWAYVAAILLAWHAVSTTRAYPVYLAYSNEAWGGPANTYKYLSDSNVDWGQQLKSVSLYLDQHGIKDCWFGYFAAPGIPIEAYGIPCKPLVTADTMWMHAQIDVPPSITGTVLVSAGALTGFEFGSAVLSPYQPFVNLKPTAVIDRGVFVFNGTFDTSFASSLGHVTRATDLAAAKQFDAALAEAQQAVAINPNVLQAQVILGDTLMQLKRYSEAKAAYTKAMTIVRTMEPDAQVDWIPQIESKIHSSEM
jgi:Dolichyl-phosphate-mannose-protein mannosyltransferase